MALVDNSPCIPSHIELINTLIDEEEPPVDLIYLKYKILNHKDLSTSYKYHSAQVYRISTDKSTVVFLVIDDPKQEFIILEYNKNELTRGFLYSEHVKHYYEEHEYLLCTKEELNTYYLKHSYVSLENFKPGDDYDIVECFDFSIAQLDDF